MVLTMNGLFFVKIKMTKVSEENDTFKFELNHREHYFKGKAVKGAFEYTQGKIIALVEGEKNIRFVDRTKEKEDTNIMI